MADDVQKAQAFAALEAIRAGLWDDILSPIVAEAQHRLSLYVPHRQPKRPPPEPHQVWAWMNGPGEPHWEIRGTGVVMPEHLRRAVTPDEQ